MLSSIILFTCLHKIFTRQTQDKQHICVYVKDYGILILLKKDYYYCTYTTNISIQTNNLDIVLHADACVCYFPPLVSKNHIEIMIFEQIRVHFLKNEVNKFKDLFTPRAFFLSYDGW